MTVRILGPNVSYQQDMRQGRFSFVHPRMIRTTSGTCKTHHMYQLLLYGHHVFRRLIGSHWPVSPGYEALRTHR